MNDATMLGDQQNSKLPIARKGTVMAAIPSTLSAPRVDDAAKVLSAPMSRRRVVIATVVGNGLEFFDFTVFSFFVVIIGKQYFPNQSSFNQTLLTLGIFGAGYLIRPLGGIVLGAMADHQGRKAAMMWTLSLMALGTLMVGATPTFDQIGYAAPVLMVISRLIQGFAAGGEIGVTTAYLIEVAPSGRRGLYSGWQFVSQGVGVALGGALSFAVAHNLSPHAYEAWGWRLPFFAGVLIVPIGMVIRKQLSETIAANERHATFSDIFKDLAKFSWTPLLLGVGIILGQTVTANINLYMATYVHRSLALPAAYGMLIGMVHGLTLLVMGTAAAYASDVVGRRNVALIVIRCIQIAVVFPCFWLFTHQPSLTQLIMGTIVNSAVFAASVAGMNVLIMEHLPKSVRTAGFSLIYALTVAVFGGLTQPAVTWAIEVTGNPMMPAWFIAAAAVISIVALSVLKDRHGLDMPPRQGFGR
jgi:MHS family proline/betaine transporter-like MFS transporter